MAICHSAWSQAIFGKVVARGRHSRSSSGSRRRRGRTLARTLGAPHAARPRRLQQPLHGPRPPLSLPAHARRGRLLPPRPARPRPLPHARRSRAAVRAELDTPADARRHHPGEPHGGVQGSHAAPARACVSCRRLDGWVCWMIGGGQRPRERAYEERLKAEARRARSRRRVCASRGSAATFLRLLAAADIYSQPNTAPESFGLTFVEAHARGPARRDDRHRRRSAK